MRTNRGQRFTFMSRAVMLAGALFLLMGANDDNGCAPAPGGAGECSAAADCIGQPHPACVGAWHCNAGQCSWECGSTTPPPTGCYSDADCSGDRVCNAADVCLSPPGCEQGQPCPAVCYGECVAPPVDPPGPTPCMGSGQCASGQHCSTEDGVCHRPPGCGPNDVCPAVCYGECVDDGTPPGACWSPRDCGYGEVCNFDGCDQPGMPNGLVACPGVCEPAETCTSDDECAPGEICGCASFSDDGDAFKRPCRQICQPDPNAGCVANGDCAPGQVCEAGRCVDGGGSCADGSVMCGVGEHCETTCSAVPCDCADGAGSDDGDCACPAIAACRSECVPDFQICSSDDDCRDDQACRCNDPGTWGDPGEGGGAERVACAQVCVPREGMGCTDDAVCGDGYHCERAACPMTACDCDPSFESCVCPGEPPCVGRCTADGPTACVGDWDCGEHEMCTCGIHPTDGSGDGGSESDRPACFRECVAKPFDCSTDRPCQNGGTCEPVLCAGAAPAPCDAGDASCDPAERPAPPEPACWGYCTDPGPQECGPNGECPAGSHCGCGWPSTDPASPSGVACFPMCVPDDPGHEHCTSTSDCGEHEECRCGPGFGMQNGLVCNLQCLPAPYDCSSPSDCASGICDYEICSGAADPAPCASDDCANRPAPPAECKGYCAPPEEPIMCDDQGQCPAGYHCGCGAPYGGSGGGASDRIACFQQCLPDGQPGTCDGPEDCPAGQICAMTGSGGRCVDAPPTPCLDADDCGPGQRCEPSICPASLCTYDEATGQVVCPPCYGTCEEAPAPTTCMRTGCSAQVCAAAPVFTTCEYRDWYQCFDLATCGASADGECGWQGNAAFEACMAAHGASSF